MANSIEIYGNRRKQIFSDDGYSLRAGVPVAAVGILFYIIGRSFIQELNQNDYLKEKGLKTGRGGGERVGPLSC